MATWQYAWLTDQPYTTIGFSHPQPGLASELAGILGAGVFTAQSNEWQISLDRSRINLGYVSGLMGDRGWEMFAVETRLQPNAMTPSQLQTNWYFKRPGSDKPSGAAVSQSSSMNTAPSAPAAAPQSSFAPAAPAAPAAAPASAPTYDTSLSSTPSMSSPASEPASSWQSAPQAPSAPAAPLAPTAPAAPAAPAGPEQAPMSGSNPPPPGPQG